MIPYAHRTLRNGLRVVFNRDRESKMAAVNLLYRVGARNEEPSHTGFAHLFEHLMFRGTKRVPDFDTPVQMACGENNAFTNNDYTDYYITLPRENVATAFWLESDRMQHLALTPRNLALEKQVVIEEFKQRYLNQPYGDLMMLLRSLAYKSHPYRWATIGLTPDHIASATHAQVRSFYRRYYHPSNAILSVSADMEQERLFDLAEQWFGSIPDAGCEPFVLAPEPEQTGARRQQVERAVPATAIAVAFRMGGRLSRQFYQGDLISDLLAGGDSGRLPRRLVQQERLYSSVNAYVTGDLDPGLFVITGQLMPGVEEERAEEAIWRQIELLQREAPSAYELEKVKNKFEANTLFGELNVMNKAMNLGFYTMLGDTQLINREVEIFRSIGGEEVAEASRTLFRKESSNTLIYRASHE